MYWLIIWLYYDFQVQKHRKKTMRIVQSNNYELVQNEEFIKRQLNVLRKLLKFIYILQHMIIWNTFYVLNWREVLITFQRHMLNYVLCFNYMVYYFGRTKYFIMTCHERKIYNINNMKFSISNYYIYLGFASVLLLLFFFSI